MRSIDRVVLREAPARLQYFRTTMEGRLVLTADALLFQPQARSAQAHSLAIPLTRLVALRPCWTRGFGLIPLAPTAFALRLDEGCEYRIAVAQRTQWIQAIVAACADLRGRAAV
ncbi:hypothetical protein LL962_12940 [Xanthomonas sp. NCPPB 1067]|uniref:hypothetical protein n=1 Tax=Xanthomonas TaxID=338 RepID=UPI001ABF363D|nr:MULTISPECIES: hypothetical protein [Xanthomonas]MCC4587998.1 hypothetical protein [Xanthomonas sp. NCPPB 1067]MCC4600770.1 hypothetical protein [Xanthomonas melonis]MCD0247316.1 hypothetical protein [Xanthomonas melonis]MCD0281016.1 hypothetical protein [Xanthomonas melonis]